MHRILTELKAKLHDATTDVRRIFHGRGRVYEGLYHINIDHFNTVLLITLYDEPDKAWLNELIREIRQWVEPIGISCLMVQRRHVHRIPSEVVWGCKPDSVIITETGLKYIVHPGKAQNSGFFIDTATARQWVRDNSRGKKVLNLFAYTCTFSVAAMAGGAESVINIDMKRNFLNLGKKNHQLNGMDLGSVQFWPHNILKSWSKIKRFGPYDLLIIDPPFFQKGSFSTEKDYCKLIRRIPELITEGGSILNTLNSPKTSSFFLSDMYEKECPACRFVRRLENPEDFKEKNPADGLKVLLYEY